LPFAIYHKPNTNNIVGLFQENDDLHFVNQFDEKGFVFAPFNGDTIVLIPENKSEVCVSSFDIQPIVMVKSSTNHYDNTTTVGYENLVQRAIQSIANGAFNKVVLSRKEEIEIKELDVNFLFQN